MRSLQILQNHDRTSPASRARGTAREVPARAGMIALAGAGTLVLTLGLAGCKMGGSDSPKADAPAPAAPAPAQTTEAAASGTSGGLTPPGTHLALGQKATVGW